MKYDSPGVRKKAWVRQMMVLTMEELIIYAKFKCSYCGSFVDIWEFTALTSIHEYLDMEITGMIFIHFDQYMIEHAAKY